MKYAIIADIHEDIVNLKFAFRKIEKLNCDEIICLGDISGFSVPHYNYFDTRNAHECLRLIRANCKIIVAGNHDLHAAGRFPTINPVFTYPESWYKMDYDERLNESDGKVWLYDENELDPLYTNSDIDFLRTLPEYHILETKNQNVLLSHYFYPNLTGSSREFYSSAEDFESHKEYMSGINCHFGIAGHRHYVGLLVASDNKLIKKRYNNQYTPKANDCMLVPPITGSKISKGFCIFDVDNFVIKAQRF